jgi:hypothetical protein
MSASFKSAAFSLAIVLFLAGSALADSFTFTGQAAYGQDISDFFISCSAPSAGRNLLPERQRRVS